MTQREKKLMTGLIGAVAMGGGAAILFLFALEPVKAASERVRNAQKQLDDKTAELLAEETQFDQMVKVNPRLRQWKHISLPPRPPSLTGTQKMTEEHRKQHLPQLQVDYEKFLFSLMDRHRFKSDSIKVLSRPVEKQSTAKGKQAAYERIAFLVEGRGDLENVSNMLQEFHQAPLLHQIRGITVEAAALKGKNARESDLDVKMNVEALLVNGAIDRTGLLPSKLTEPVRVLAEPARNYALMDKKNMFFGIKPKVVVKSDEPKKEIPKKVEPVKPSPKEDPADVLNYVKVTMLCYDPDRRRWEATVYDQGKGGDETKLNTGVKSELKVYDRYRELLLDAKVIYIDEKQMVIKVDRKYYRLKCGDVLYAAMRESLTTSELKELGITVY
jgi:hypothetical protein